MYLKQIRAVFFQYIPSTDREYRWLVYYFIDFYRQYSTSYVTEDSMTRCSTTLGLLRAGLQLYRIHEFNTWPQYRLLICPFLIGYKLRVSMGNITTIHTFKLIGPKHRQSLYIKIPSYTRGIPCCSLCWRGGCGDGAHAITLTETCTLCVYEYSIGILEKDKAELKMM